MAIFLITLKCAYIQPLSLSTGCVHCVWVCVCVCVCGSHQRPQGMTCAERVCECCTGVMGGKMVNESGSPKMYVNCKQMIQRSAHVCRKEKWLAHGCSSSAFWSHSHTHSPYYIQYAGYKLLSLHLYWCMPGLVTVHTLTPYTPTHSAHTQTLTPTNVHRRTGTCLV